jgi:hypothetical protein
MINNQYLKTFFDKSKKYDKSKKFNYSKKKETKLSNETIKYLEKLYSSNTDRGLNQINILREKFDSESQIILKNEMLDVSYYIEKYHNNFEYNIWNEKDVPLELEDINKNLCKQVIDFIQSSTEKKNNMLKYFGKGEIYGKYKTGDKEIPSNYRFIHNHLPFIKLADSIIIDDLVNKCTKQLDSSIYLYKIHKNQNFKELSVLATENTNEMTNVVLLDITKAFDNIEWNLVSTLLFRNLCKKMTEQQAYIYTNIFYIITTRRQMKYNNTNIKLQKGLPTGLPSSAILFTFIMEEIMDEWFTEYRYKNNIDFIINIYVDDIYIKFKNPDIAESVISSLINKFNKYNLHINNIKSKYYEKLNITSLKSILKDTDAYLGILFTRNIKKYGIFMLNEIKERQNIDNWKKIYNIISTNDDKETKIKLLGYLRYKLKPFIKKNINEKYDKLIIEFIKNNYINKISKNLILVIILVIILVYLMIFLIHFYQLIHIY